MGILSNEVNYNNLKHNLNQCCLENFSCKHCNKRNCLIGYSKINIYNCMKNNVTYVENGFDNIPVSDTKIYDTHSLVVAIADILKQCRSCKEDHFNNCLINVLRSCYEVALFGEPQEYDGNALSYLKNLQNINKDIADKIFIEYRRK